VGAGAFIPIFSGHGLHPVKNVVAVLCIQNCFSPEVLFLAQKAPQTVWRPGFTQTCWGGAYSTRMDS